MRRLPLSLLFLFLILLTLQGIEAQEIKPDLTIKIPMRDGIELPTDLYLPSPEARGLPCILLRSPSGRHQPYWQGLLPLAKAGYVIAIQETRNVLDPEGKTFPFLSDGWDKLQDGYDTVEWLAKSPYTNGKIGTWGLSALGITQLLMAPTQPPHLCCQYIMFAASSLYHQGLFPGGQLLKNQTEGWLGYYARDMGILGYLSQRAFYDDFWKLFNTLEVAPRIQVPGFHLAGWYDTFLQGSLTAFKSRQEQGGEGARGKQKLVIGPWTHFWPFSEHFGDFEMPPAGKSPPWDISPKHWFDHYLKGISNGMDRAAAVTYYVMGPFDGSPSSGNIWRTSDVWPIPAVETSFYLTPDFALAPSPPQEEGKRSYRYDPAHPIPTLGGRNLFLESGPKDQRAIETRDDVLVFTSPKLEEDCEVTGALLAKLFFSSDREDTDLVVRLSDVYPDGKSVLIAEGGARLGVLRKEKKEAKLQEEPLEVEIDLWSTSLVFAKGHAIRLSISSSSYPRYEKNRNIGLVGANKGKEQVAHQTIYMGGKRASRLLLPIIKY